MAGATMLKCNLGGGWVGCIGRMVHTRLKLGHWQVVTASDWQWGRLHQPNQPGRAWPRLGSLMESKITNPTGKCHNTCSDSGPSGACDGLGRGDMAWHWRNGMPQLPLSRHITPPLPTHCIDAEIYPCNSPPRPGHTVYSIQQLPYKPCTGPGPVNSLKKLCMRMDILPHNTCSIPTVSYQALKAAGMWLFIASRGALQGGFSKEL